MDGVAPAPARTIDLGPTGMSLTLGHMVQTGHAGQVSFEMFVDGKPVVISCRSRVTYCIFSGDDVKVGFQFVSPDSNALAAIAKFMR
jgi:hypothetical protein